MYFVERDWSFSMSHRATLVQDTITSSQAASSVTVLSSLDYILVLINVIPSTVKIPTLHLVAFPFIYLFKTTLLSVALFPTLLGARLWRLKDRSLQFIRRLEIDRSHPKIQKKSKECNGMCLLSSLCRFTKKIRIPYSKEGKKDDHYY